MSAHMDHKTSSSSEDGIGNLRLVDADWNHNSRDAVKGRATQTDKSEKDSRTRHLIMSEVKKPSIREMIYQESYDQLNEDPENVKATPEFKSFVAKKLSSALDGKLKMTVSEKEKTLNDEKSKKNEEDSFRLFSSSCCAPNLNTPESAPHVKRKRPRIRRNTKKLSQDNYDDSSDSDVIDQRLAEAAISGNEILSFSALSTPTGHNAKEVQYTSSDDSASHVLSKRSRTVDDALIKKEVGFKHTEVGDDEFLQENVKKKNKKKKKKKKMDTDAINDDGNEKGKAENCLTQIVSSSDLLKENEQDDLSEKNIEKKKKKKKRKKMETSAIHGHDCEQLKGENRLTQMVRSSELSKGKDRGDSSEEIVNNKNKKKMKKRVDTNASSRDDH